MAGKEYVRCIGPSYHLADIKAAVQSAINCFPCKLDDKKWMLGSAEGTTSLSTDTGEGRGGIVVSDTPYAVYGNKFYSVTTAGVKTELGTLMTSEGLVSLANNTTQIALVDGDNLYIYTISSAAFTQITSSGWRGSNNVKEIDGYFVFMEPGTDQYYLSAIDDGTDLDALDFTSADAQPDTGISLAINHHQLWVLGEYSSEIHINSGGAAFPFAAYKPFPIDIGCVGPHAAVNAADTLAFVGKTRRGGPVVYLVEGNSPTPISNTAVEEALKESTDLSQCYMWSYQTPGHEFIGINAPGVDTTWVYDARVKQWHERGEWIDGVWEPLRWVTVLAVGTEHYAVSDDGEFSLIDPDVNQLSGRHLVRERTWPHLVSPSLEPVVYQGLELAAKTGSGGQIALQISNDGGENFGPPLLRSLGATGRWLQKVRWTALGASHNRVFRIRQSDNVPFGIYSAAVDT